MAHLHSQPPLSLFVYLVIVFTALSTAACRPSAPDVQGSPAERAEHVWSNRCAACHGVNGTGDGPAARGIRAHPRDFTSRGWQEAATNARIRKVIVEGGASIGLSHVMSKNPDLAEHPEVVDELIKIVRRKGNFGPDGEPLPTAP